MEVALRQNLEVGTAADLDHDAFSLVHCLPSASLQLGSWVDPELLGVVAQPHEPSVTIFANTRLRGLGRQAIFNGHHHAIDTLQKIDDGCKGSEPVSTNKSSSVHVV